MRIPEFNLRRVGEAEKKSPRYTYGEINYLRALRRNVSSMLSPRAGERFFRRRRAKNSATPRDRGETEQDGVRETRSKSARKVTSDSRYSIQRNVLSRRRVTALPSKKSERNGERPSSANARTYAHKRPAASNLWHGLSPPVAVHGCSSRDVSGKTVILFQPHCPRIDRIPSRLIERTRKSRAWMIPPFLLLAHPSIRARLSLDFIASLLRGWKFLRWNDSRSDGVYFQARLKIQKDALNASLNTKAPCRALSGLFKINGGLTSYCLAEVVVRE